MSLITQLSETPPFMWGFSTGLSGKACEVTETILSLRPYEMLEKDFRFLLETRMHPEYFSRYLPVFLESPAIDKADLLSFAWDRLVMYLCFSMDIDEHNDVHSWVPAFRYLIEQDVDIHRLVRPAMLSAYDYLLRPTNYPFEADEVVCFWLKILKICGVDIHGYVQIQSSIIERRSPFAWEREDKRKMVILDFEGLPMLSWRCEPPTRSDIYELLGEFHSLGSHSFRFWLCAIGPSGPEDFKHWSANNHNWYWNKNCFPFLPAPMDCVLGMDDSILDRLWCRETYNRAVEIRYNRLARRQAKKWRKAHPGEKTPSRTMPGAWVD